MPDLTVVLPVHDPGDLLGGCLAATGPELEANDAELVIVDDGTPDPVAVASAGGDLPHVRTERLPTSRGPYAARNVGWRATSSRLVVFLDVRCRPRPGWLRALATAIEAPGVAVAGGGYRVLDGPTAAARLMAHHQPFLAAASLADQLPFLPGGNLVLRREALEALGGFDETMRSGGDLVLCYEAQLQGVGTVVDAPGAVVDWVPRSGACDYVEQRRRYGDARPRILARFRDRGVEVPRPSRAPSLGPVREFLANADGLPPGARALQLAAEIAHHRAYRRAWSALQLE